MVYGYIPMGIGYAALAMKAGFNPFQTVSMSFLVFAGAGQIMAVSMFAQGATLLNIVLTSFVVNFRYFIMNTVVYNKLTENTPKLNILSAHFVVDESFAIFSLMEKSSIWIYLGVSVIPFCAWVLGAAIGVLVLNALPIIVANSFNISLYALFVAILIPNIKRSKNIAITVIITGILNYLLSFVISHWSLIVATLLGAFIGMYIVDDDEVNIKPKTDEDIQNEIELEAQ
ncbi:AzlC family ABC transporter permease [Methanobrevibacter boviskoreani]|uniref:AzlC family ABC transporter permease n=1 Tax=Methanobrevibacter boviskoreani TaxID=1348249 RepID=UPI002584D5F4|nr:AzlC family ABC transporter permease [Methanobrevibacter boviskoreani]MDY5613932.1 AzlC family ABC transporter permease [Methanobrevibacter boviskoreani]